MLDLLLAGAVGYALGVLSERYKPRNTPLRLVRRFALDVHTAPPAPGPEQAAQWELYLQAFAFWGEQCSFSNRTMCSRWKVCTDPAWETYMDLLTKIGAVVRQPRRGSQWSAGWSARHLRLVLKHGLITPPYPAGPAPFVGSQRKPTQTTQVNTATQARRGSVPIETPPG